MEKMTPRFSWPCLMAILGLAIQSDKGACQSIGTSKCENLMLPAHGIALRNNPKVLFNAVEVACSPGYRLVGSKWKICTANGKWKGLPARCEDVDECSAEGDQYPCNDKADCVNTVGSFHCVCLPGFDGNGFNCEKSAHNLLQDKADKCGMVLIKNKTMISRKRFRRIVGGKLSYAGEWPWQASIEIKKKARLPFMGGALIKSGWVLTVASQLFIGTRLVKPKEVKVVLGDFDRAKSEYHEQRFEVSKVHVHPKFDRKKVAYDIALLKLKKAEKRTPYVNAVCLVGGRKARMFEDDGHLATVTGWGTTMQVDIWEDPGHFSWRLKETTIPLQNVRTCKKATAYDFYPRTMLCAGYVGGDRSPCYGDHGAPLVIQDPSSHKWVLIGLYSWSEGCGKRERFSYYTRVSKFRKWITGLVRNT